MRTERLLTAWHFGAMLFFCALRSQLLFRLIYVWMAFGFAGEKYNNQHNLPWNLKKQYGYDTIKNHMKGCLTISKRREPKSGYRTRLEETAWISHPIRRKRNTVYLKSLEIHKKREKPSDTNAFIAWWIAEIPLFTPRLHQLVLDTRKRQFCVFLIHNQIANCTMSTDMWLL